MAENFREFRCVADNALLGKMSVSSQVEIKCRKCKILHQYALGTSFYYKTPTELVPYEGNGKIGN